MSDAPGIARKPPWFKVPAPGGERYRELGLEPVPSAANFILVRVPDGAKAFDFLQARGTIVRPFGDLPNHVRVSVGTAGQNERCLANLRAWFASRS